MLTHEMIDYGAGLPIRLIIQKIGSVNKHWHQSMELLMVLTGEVTVTVEDNCYELKEDDLILINCNQIHETNSESAILALLQIRLSMLKSSGISSNVSFICNSATTSDKERFYNIKTIMARLIMLTSDSQEKASPNLLIMAYTHMLLHELTTHFSVPADKVISHSDENLDRLSKITNYIEAHYMEEVSLDRVAREVHLNSAYLSHFFRKNMGMSFSDYLTKTRLIHAVKQLISTQKLIKDIALDNGFPNPRAFATAFRREYHVLPSEFREQQKNGSAEQSKHTSTENYLELKKHDYLRTLHKYLEPHDKVILPESTEGIERKTIAFSALGELKPLRHSFRTFTSVGRATDLLRSDVQEMLRDIQQKIGYRYIKFHGILDDAMMVYDEDSTGTPYLSFYHVDRALDFLLEIGLKPLIQFSFMPRKLAHNPEQTLFASPVIISPPKDLKKWQYLITEMTRHLIQRYGAEEVRQWLFTCWNESLFPSPFAFDSMDTNLVLYKNTYDSVKTVDPELRFGNPSFFTMRFPEPFFEQFMNYAQENNCLPDFYLLHFFPTNGQFLAAGNFGNSSSVSAQAIHRIQLSPNPNAFHEFIQSWEQYKTSIPARPAYLTEWNSSPSHRDWLNDTCYRSAYIVKNVCENYDRLDSFGLWTLTDAIEELPMPEELFHGGIGLFTRNGVKKPALYALEFLNQLHDYLVHQENGCFVTTDECGNYAILLYNYHHFSSLYAQGILLDSSPESRYDVFGTTRSIEVCLQISDVPDGTYRLKEYIVSRDYGSSYDEWVRMGSVPLEEKQDIELLNRRSTPFLSQLALEVSGGVLTHYAKLQPHEIRLIKIVNVNGS